MMAAKSPYDHPPFHELIKKQVADGHFRKRLINSNRALRDLQELVRAHTAAGVFPCLQVSGRTIPETPLNAPRALYYDNLRRDAWTPTDALVYVDRDQPLRLEISTGEGDALIWRAQQGSLYEEDVIEAGRVESIERLAKSLRAYLTAARAHAPSMTRELLA